MSHDLRRPHDGQETIAGPSFVVNNQQNEFHGDVTIVQNHFYGHFQPGWKPSRRCAAIEFERLSRHFCGRDRELEQIGYAFRAQEGSHRCAVYGMSGLGKSHLAIKYGKTSYDSRKYTHVFWISADTEAKLLNGLESILAKLEHPAQTENDQKTKVETARCWLEDAEEDQGWLLILDNARRESFDSLRNNLPSAPPHGHILLTTQFEDVAKTFVTSQQNKLSLLRLPPLAEEDGFRLLINHSDLSSDELSDQDREKVHQLVRRTGCHPLAITFAAACATSTTTLYDLIEWTHDDQLSMITEHEDALAETDQQVIKHFFDRQIESVRDDSLALDLFRTLSFLDTSSISVKMLWRGIQYLIAAWKEDPQDQRPMHPLTCRMVQLQKCIQKLASQNLLQVGSPGFIGIHDLTNHLSLRSTEDADETAHYQDLTLQLVCSSFAAIQEPSLRDNWAIGDETISHFFKLSSIGRPTTTSFFSRNLYWSFDKAAAYLKDRGRYADSQSIYKSLLTARMKDLGPEHPHTLLTMYNLGSVHASQGRLREAEELLLRVRAERERQLGPTDLETLTTLHTLASVHQSQGRYSDAEDIFQRVLTERQRHLGPRHTETLATMEELAGLYQSQGRYQDAEELLQDVLTESEKLYGPAHPHTLSALHNLASLYQSQGRYEESETFHRRVLTESTNVFGHIHPETLTTMHELGVIYHVRGRYLEAEEVFRQVLKKREEIIGPEHPQTLATRLNLAVVHESQGRNEEAEVLLLRVLVSYETCLGRKHPHTLSALQHLAFVYECQGRYQEANDALDRVLIGQQEQLGPDHPSTLSTLHSLASVHASQEHYQEATELFEQALTDMKRRLGPEHLETLSTMHELAITYEAQDRLREAEELLSLTLVGMEKIYGSEHDLLMIIREELDEVRVKITEPL